MERRYSEITLVGDSIARLPALVDPPIVIGGCGRSGTTLLLSMLSCHPRIAAIADETMAFATPRFEIGRVFLALMTQQIRDTATCWAEKTPRNVHQFSRLSEYFDSQVRLIVMVRDGRDVITSIHPRIPDRFYVTPERWIEDVEAGLRVESSALVLTIRYEDLIARSKVTLQRICAFVGLDFHPDLMRFPATATLRTNRAWASGVSRLYSDSVGRWRNPRYSVLTEEFMARPEVPRLLAHHGYV